MLIDTKLIAIANQNICCKISILHYYIYECKLHKNCFQSLVIFRLPISLKQIELDLSSESQNGCFKKTKHAKFFKKCTFLTPWYRHVCVSGGMKCSFFGKFRVLWFLETPVLRFTLLPQYRRTVPEYKSNAWTYNNDNIYWMK